MIELKRINLKFKDRVIFDDFSFSLEEGGIAVLRAPSGEGKTLLVHMMLGFMKPDSGSITIDGEVLNKGTVDAIRSRICYVGQDALLPDGRAGDVLGEIAKYAANKHKDFSDARIAQMLEIFSLPEGILDKKVELISGGERRRLAFVICALIDREIWLLDEVTAGLDEARKRAVIEYILGSGKTVVAISHDEVWDGYPQVRRVSW